MTPTITRLSPDTRGRIDSFFARIGQGLNAYLETHSRRDQIEVLGAKSDEELARMGPTRDRIIAHVFRDVIWL